MKGHNKHVPPPPPALPSGRPDGKRAGNGTGSSILPAKSPLDWLKSKFDSAAGRLPPPIPPPAPPRQIQVRNTPPDESRARSESRTRDTAQAAPENARPVEAPELGSEINVLMTCARTDEPFLVEFRYKWSLSGARFKHDRTSNLFPQGGRQVLLLPSETHKVPVSSLDWAGVECPHCLARCRPIHCGRCDRLVCDGQTVEANRGTFFRCAPSCRMEGYVADGLEEISCATLVVHAPRLPTRAARILMPETPAPNGPKLPKPR